MKVLIKLSNCAEAHADLGLRSAHMPEDMFTHIAAHTCIMEIG